MAHAWPRLETLRMVEEEWRKPPANVSKAPPPTFDSLVHLVRNCPELEVLALPRMDRMATGLNALRDLAASHDHGL
ncbi:hypothetical protein C8Q76DRAFT_709046 [Earliella scabrosa]|nr:hypothetical protein C8Q76DRAFT_709046 [Earliella scabrosa]